MRRVLAACAVLMVVAIAGCDSGRSFDQTRGEPPAFSDQMDPATRDRAVAELSQAVQQGTQAYRLQPGDVIEVLYNAAQVPTVRDYRIGVGDELEITLNTDPPRTQSYVVRPDGRFALPDHGEILAAGQRPADLGRAIAARLADTYVNPSVTVNVRRFTTNSDDFLAMISSPTSARAENITVAPDGTITPPLLQSIRAVGHTTDELTSIVDHDYGQRLGSITTTIRLNSVAAQQVFVFGEVQRPGPIPALRARTVLQLIASAGGPNEFAAMNAVRVLYWDAAGQAHIRQVNVMAVLDTLSLDEDVAVPPNAVVYVPPTQLAKAGRMVNQILQRLFLFQGTSVGLQFGNTNTFLK